MKPLQHRPLVFQLLTARWLALLSPALLLALPFAAATFDALGRACGLDVLRTGLAEVTARFNRHNALQLAIAEPALGARRIGGIFALDDVEAFVRLLERDGIIRAERRGDTLLVKGPARQGLAAAACSIWESMAPRRFLVDLDAIRENIARFLEEAAYACAS